MRYNKDTKLVLTGKKELCKSLEVNHLQLAVDSDSEQKTGTIFAFVRTAPGLRVRWSGPIPLILSPGMKID